MVSWPAPIIAVMNVVVVVIIIVVTTDLGMTEIRWAMRALSVAAPAISAAWHSSL